MAQYAHMESTERDLFCGRMSNKETRDEFKQNPTLL
jgi:hypothetical protein